MLGCFCGHELLRFGNTKSYYLFSILTRERRQLWMIQWAKNSRVGISQRPRTTPEYNVLFGAQCPAQRSCRAEDSQLDSTMVPIRRDKHEDICSDCSIGKHLVDGYIRELGLPGCFIFTGNFYENMILRKHMSYDENTDTITFTQPIIKEDAQC